jgi:hypothetical protein
MTLLQGDPEKTEKAYEGVRLEARVAELEARHEYN